jgi:hypothetical protein
MEPGKAGDSVFQNTGKNEKMSQIPDTFMKAVNNLRLYLDSLDKVRFGALLLIWFFRSATHRQNNRMNI